jgi:glutathione S-transferase
MLDHTPVPDKRERWRVLTAGGYSAGQLREAMESVLFVFGRMEEELAKRGPWLAGKTYSLGDISMLAIAHRVSELAPDKLDRAMFPRLMDWWDRSMARPAAAYVYAGNTEETPKRPPKKTIAGIAEFRI